MAPLCSDMNPRSNTAPAFIWSFIERIGTQVLRSVFAIILARLLVPKDFGLVAVLSVFIGVAEVIVSSGFGTALIRKKVLSHVDECSIFYFNVVVGVIMTTALFCAAPYVAAFYRLPQLTSIGRVTSFNLLVNSLCAVQWCLLARKLDFLTLCKVSIISTLISGILGIVLASSGFGVWSIVAQQLSGNLANVALLWRLAGWRPVAGFDFQSLRGMFGFGSSFACINLLDVFARNLSSAIIGRRFTTAEAGLYSRAMQIEELPVMTTYYSISRPSLSLFAASQDHEAQLAHHFRSALTQLAMINFPVMVGLGIVARPLVATLLTVRWLECVPLLQLLCAVGIFLPLQRINLNVIIAKGYSALFFQLELARTVMAVMCISIAGLFGIKTMILSQIAAMATTWYVNSIWTTRVLSYTFRRQLDDVLPYALASCVMAGGMVCLKSVNFASNIKLLIGQTLLGTCLYVSLCWVFHLSAFLQLKDVVKVELAHLRLWNPA
jgi:O-antigen/teichoic acid export membrane protein